MNQKLPIIALLLLPCLLTGCSGIDNISAGLSAVYAVTAAISLLLLVGYLCAVRSKSRWFTLLFSSVAVVNCGYLLLALSTSLEEALIANRISYLGAVFLPLSMLMALLETTELQRTKRLPAALLTLAGVVFLVAASPGYLPIYYKEVSFEIVNGAATLNKVYGDWHFIYLVYLLGYFAAMGVVIIHARINKKLPSGAHAAVITFAVAVNLGVWLMEQLVDIDFEFLSVSYIISELFLLGLYLFMQEEAHTAKAEEEEETPPPAPEALYAERVLAGLSKLTQTEQRIFECYLDGMRTHEILDALGITENTLKFHNKNLYRKFGVSSRRDLMELYKKSGIEASKLQE